jgi:hypothetical protein
MVTDKLPITYIPVCTINDEVIFNTGKLIGLITKTTHIHPGKNQDLPF